VSIEVAAAGREPVDAALERLRGALASPEPEDDDVPFAFWACNVRGRGKVRHRNLEAAEWSDVRANYAASTAAGIDALMSLREPDRGRLILWHGVPGTGKTNALHALARAWRDWCSAHCVLDPEALLSPDPNYLLDVLESKEDGWRLIILEDAGELARLDAGRASGMGQLLNLTDGLMGRGARTLVLITTNEPASVLNPALRRPGRCLAEVEFAPLSAAEASRWLDAELPRAHTLSELFALRDGHDEVAPEGLASRPAFGFARAILSEALKPDLERVISQ
jgi:SpoVK/Ycf46/Vps4 family AAA+-type ATPase